MSMNEPHINQWRIRTVPGEVPIVELNGEDVTPKICGFAFEARAQQVPVLTLWHQGGAEDVVGAGVVHVVDAPNALATITEFLDTIDPGVAESAALEALGWGEGEHATTRALLAYLRTQAIALYDG